MRAEGKTCHICKSHGVSNPKHVSGNGEHYICRKCHASWIVFRKSMVETTGEWEVEWNEKPEEAGGRPREGDAAAG